MPPPEVIKTKPNKVASRQPVALEEGTLVKPGDALGFGTSMMVSTSVAEKILAGMILPIDKEKVE